jgi:hypothetical protein
MNAQTLAASALADFDRYAAALEPVGVPFAGSGNCLANITRDYDARRAGNWFDRDTMRFFGTKFATGFLDIPSAGVTLFVTTEKGPHGPRAATLRAYMWASAEIKTLGPFNETKLGAASRAMDRVASALIARALDRAAA